MSSLDFWQMEALPSAESLRIAVHGFAIVDDYRQFSFAINAIRTRRVLTAIRPLTDLLHAPVRSIYVSDAADLLGNLGLQAGKMLRTMAASELSCKLESIVANCQSSDEDEIVINIIERASSGGQGCMVMQEVPPVGA